MSSKGKVFGPPCENLKLRLPKRIDMITVGQWESGTVKLTNERFEPRWGYLGIMPPRRIGMNTEINNPCIDGGPHSVVWQQPEITGCHPKDLEEVCIECGGRIRFIRYNIRNGTYKAATEE